MTYPSKPVYCAMIATLAGYIVPLAPALAQDSTTSCVRNGAYVNCDTHTTPSTPDAIAAFSQRQQEQQAETQQAISGLVQRLVERKREARERKLRESYAAADAAIRQDVINKITAGDCPGAINLALLAGNLDLATQAKAFCAAGTASRP